MKILPDISEQRRRAPGTADHVEFPNECAILVYNAECRGYLCTDSGHILLNHYELNNAPP